jgi:SAM-dependent methyltransferase
LFEKCGMKVIVCPFGSEKGKFFGIVKSFPQAWSGSVLDVGCRSGRLGEMLKEMAYAIRYHGVDLYPPADTVCDLNKGLPFGDSSQDTVVALDVLEHTDDIHSSFKELLRVARHYVIVSLPNGYVVDSRIKFLLGERISGKYGLPPSPPTDRHRWLFSFREAMAFTRTISEKNGFSIETNAALIGPRRGAGPGRLATAMFPNLLAPTYVALIKKAIAVGIPFL